MVSCNRPKCLAHNDDKALINCSNKLHMTSDCRPYITPCIDGRPNQGSSRSIMICCAVSAAYLTLPGRWCDDYDSYVYTNSL